MQRERRVIASRGLRVERRADDKGPVIRGYAAVFNQMSEDLGWFIEEIKPGAFSKTIKEDDIRALWNHDSNHVLGRNVAGTLALSEDERGLLCEITPPAAQWATDLTVSIERGDVSQMSFGFYARGEEWRRENDKNVRTLTDVVLFDVSPVTFPAYPQTEVGMRSLRIAGAPFDPLGAILLRAQRGLPLTSEDRATLAKASADLATMSEPERVATHASDLRRRLQLASVDL